MPQATIDDDLDEDKPEVLAEDNGNTPDPEPAPAKAADAAHAEDEEQKPQRIPKARFDEVVAERNWLREQMAALRTPQASAAPAPAQQEPEFDLDSALRARLRALSTGDDEEVLKLDRQITDHTTRQARAEALREFEAQSNARDQRRTASELAEVAADLKSRYPQLDDKGDKADHDAIDFVIFKRDKLMAEGVAPAKALQRAAELAASRFGFGEKGEKGEAPTPAAPKSDRLTDARARNADAASRQPPQMGGQGDRARGSMPDVASMTEEEFASLSPAEKRRLRGDL
jgi:predicted transglutaminase-like cysteine proteinase